MKNRKPRTDGSYVVNVSFKPNETSLLAYADTKGNFSQYVKQLIHEDMNKKQEPQSLQLDGLMAKLLFEKLIGNGDYLKDILQNMPKEEEVSVDTTKKPKEKKEDEKLGDKNAMSNIMGALKK